VPYAWQEFSFKKELCHVHGKSFDLKKEICNVQVKSFDLKKNYIIYMARV